MKRILYSFAAALALGGLAGCNTMRGVGEDISAFGKYLSNSTGTSSSHSTSPPTTSY